MNFVKQGRKIIGIGRNYKAHAAELGHAVPSDFPIFFLKPTCSYLLPGKNIFIPPNTTVHHEEHVLIKVELGVVIGRDGSCINVSDAFKHVAGYTLALDMTARDIQRKAQKSGDPWTIAKGYDTFTPIGNNFIPEESIPNPHNLDLWCSVNGKLRQSGNTKDMIFDIPFLISYVSSIMRLEKGDLILTGTPEGVGPVVSGDKIDCGLSDAQTGKQLMNLSFGAQNHRSIE